MRTALAACAASAAAMFEVAAVCSDRRAWRAVRTLHAWAPTSSTQNSSRTRMAYRTAGRFSAIRRVIGVGTVWLSVIGEAGVRRCGCLNPENSHAA